MIVVLRKLIKGFQCLKLTSAFSFKDGEIVSVAINLFPSLRSLCSIIYNPSNTGEMH